jgi:hypothetical protein
MASETDENRARGAAVNSMSKLQINSIIDRMCSTTLPGGKRMLSTIDRNGTQYYYCNLAFTKDKKGNIKYQQVDISSMPGWKSDNWPQKALVHHIVWRYTHDYDFIAPDQHISHRDADKQVQNLTQESVEENESRKWCHYFGWYQCAPNEKYPRCPHWEEPCTGPEY